LEKTIKKPGVGKTLLSGAVAALCGVLPPLLFIAGGFLGNVLLAGGAVPFLFAAAIGLLGAYALYGTSGMLLAAMTVAASLLLFYLLHRRIGYFDTAMAVAALFTLMLYLLIGVRDVISGATAFHSVSEMFSELYAEFLAAANSAPGITAEQLRLMQDAGPDIAAQIPVYMPAILCGAGGLMGLANVLVCAKLGRDAGVQLRPMRRFMFWRIPTDFMWGVLVMGAGLLIASAAGVTAMDAVAAAVLTVALMPFAIQGCSLLWFLSYVRRSGMFSGVMLFIVVLFTLPASLVVLVSLGVAEQAFHIRRRIIAQGSDHRGDE